MSDDTDPHAEGADARLAGASETANPYDPEEQAEAFAAWNDGWASIEDEDDDAVDD